MTGCSIPDCPRPHMARGWCHVHYNRWYTHGDPLVTTGRTGNVGTLLADYHGKITYRQFDYWCRTGAIDMVNPANGSGSRRRLTDIEIDAVRAFIDEYLSLHDQLEELRSGRFFIEAIANRAVSARLKGANRARGTDMPGIPT